MSITSTKLFFEKKRQTIYKQNNACGENLIRRRYETPKEENMSNEMNTVNAVTDQFRAKTYNIPIKNRKKDGHIVLGIDIGYSGPKIISPGRAVSFPAYARKTDTSRLSFREPQDTDIYIRDETGTWAVGELAYDEIGMSDETDISSQLYDRAWYTSPTYRTLVKASLGAGLAETRDFKPKTDDIIHVQTGLPPKYLDDAEDVKEVFAGVHEFDMKVGKNNWESYRFKIEPQNVGVMSQPLGSLMAVCLDKNGAPLPAARYYFSHIGEVNDFGFVTTDHTRLYKGRCDTDNTITIINHAMHEILQRTCDTIREEYKVSLQVSELQTKLRTGTFYILDRKQMRRKSVSFEKIIVERSREVCEETFEALMSACNYWQDTEFIVWTGGTYMLWKDYFEDRLKDMGIMSVPGNINIPDLPLNFANAWGFQQYRNSQIR